MEHVDAEYRFALEKSQIIPDFPLQQEFTTEDRITLSSRIAKMWTTMAVLRKHGKGKSFFFNSLAALQVDTN